MRHVVNGVLSASLFALLSICGCGQQFPSAPSMPSAPQLPSAPRTPDMPSAPTVPTVACPDFDHDGFVDCKCAIGHQLCDCNDNDSSINPSATDTKGDGIDQNCDGKDG